MTEEIWRIIPSYPDYEASSLGEIRRLKPRKDGSGVGKIMKQRIVAGYAIITVMKPQNEWKNNRTSTYTARFVARLVCQAFHGVERHPQTHCAHNDGNPLNNRPDNLRWATPLENNTDQYKHGTRMHGVMSPWAKLTPELAKRLREDRKRGLVWRELAEKYNISKRTARNCVAATTWARSQ